jgi:P4 family phage/plasmid primase-like protien
MAATKEDWFRWDFELGLGADLLPVAPAGSMPTRGSKIAQDNFGKIPSALTADGHAYGIAKWQSKEITADELAVWSNDPRLSICVRASAVRAIDIDITDADQAAETVNIVNRFFPHERALRFRSNSTKVLFAFRLEGHCEKRILTISKEPLQRIEFLADGQQWLCCGSHPSGVEYQWTEFSDIPTITPEVFETIWQELATHFNQEVVGNNSTTSAQVESFIPVTEIGEADLDILREALEFPPLIKAAEDNSVWSEVGYALLSTGRVDLWQTFSQRHSYMSDYDHEAAMVWWRAHQDSIPRTDFSHIILMAKQYGWKQVEFGDLVGDPLIDDEKSSMEGLIGEIPAKHYETTDQANVHRVKDEFGGKKIIVARTMFHSWTGKYWKQNDAEAYRCAMELTNIIQREIDDARERLDILLQSSAEWQKLEYDKIARPDQSKEVKEFRAKPDGAAILTLMDRIDSLKKWQHTCEQGSTQDRAVRMLRNTMESYEPINLDAAKYLFNVENGTIDLRTGHLLPHEPRNFIDKLSHCRYLPDAKCPVFEKFILDILGGDEEMVSFMQRWFGYAMTAEISEQKILLHIGGGSNGKSTLLDAVSRIMDMYGKTAAPNLLTAENERHPTEIAELAGRRLVTAHESDDGAVLRESFIKQATGGDTLSGRFMRQDFFDFKPTHKLQLLTNHKPQVRGQDHAIWRRIMLVWYSERYGSQAAVDAGTATAVGDPRLPDKLQLESEGILAWMVRGAMDWYKHGLAPPEKVLEAGREYQMEQDRMATFVSDRCIVREDAFVAGADIYREYQSWSRENGFQTLNNNKFVSELERVVGPHFKYTRSMRVNGQQIRGMYGVTLDPQNGFGNQSAEDLL